MILRMWWHGIIACRNEQRSVTRKKKKNERELGGGDIMHEAIIVAG